MNFFRRLQGFTLIEVLLALAIISIAFVALSKATYINIMGAQRLKIKTLSHWTAIQAVNMIQLGLLESSIGEEISEKTTLLHQDIYWRATLSKTNLPLVNQIDISVSTHSTGPFYHELTAFKALS